MTGIMRKTVKQNHDGPEKNVSWNCGVEGPTRRKKITELRNRQIKNAFLMLLLASGTPMIQAGDEFGNSQGGNNNPYCLDNETSWTDWKAARRNEELTAFVREVLAFRKRHRILHMPQELKIMDTLSCGYPDLSYHGNRAWYGEFENGNREIGVMYCGQYAGEDEFIYAAYNLHWVSMSLPFRICRSIWSGIWRSTVLWAFIRRVKSRYILNRSFLPYRGARFKF